MQYNGYVWDMESDNFYHQSKTIWYINFLSLDGTKELELWPFRDGMEESSRKFLEFHNSFGENPLVVSFNGLGFDHWMLWKYLGIPFHLGKQGSDWLNYQKVQFVDLFVLSQYLDPDRPRHSLGSYGEQFGDPKIDFHDFSEYTEEMRVYGRQDVKLTLKVFKHLTQKAKELYKDSWIHPSFKLTQKDYYLYSAQALSGIKFNKESAKALLQDIEVEMQELNDKVLPQLPPRGLKEGEKKFYCFPAKPFKKDGGLSSTMEKWIEKHNAILLPDNKVQAYGKVYNIEAHKTLDVELPMEIKDGDDLKDWFQAQGWVPTMWNFKRDERGKPMRDEKGEVITTTPKIQEQGKICPNLLKIDGELPKQIVRFLSLRNRHSVITGWVNNWRLDYDGRISAEITGFTPTFRVKHSVITNLPKASPEVIKGYEVRSLFIVEEGMKYVSADAAALENRTVADFTHKYDNGKFADLVLNGDSHSFNATVFFPKETSQFDITSPDFNKDHPDFKPYRNKAKTGAYSLAYGASVKKFTKSLGLSETEGKIAYDGYWDANQGLKKFKEAVEKYWSTIGAKTRIPGRDGRFLSVRSKHLLVNLCGQNLGATVMSMAFCIVDNKLGWLQLDDKFRPYYEYKGSKVMRIAAFHDQGDYEASPEVSEEVGQMLVDGIKKAGTMLKMQVPLDGEYKVGNNAAEIH
jgi:hypothetical protein